MITDTRCYWLWLQAALGAGARLDEIRAAFSSPQAMFDAGEAEWRLSGVLTGRQIEKLLAVHPRQMESVLVECVQNGWSVLTPDDPCYPGRLRMLPDFPAALYVWGDCEILQHEVVLAIVGTREASCYALEVTRRLSAALARAGAVIASGGALGVDSAAHMGAVLGGGKTVCFLGCGLAYPYLMDNEALRRVIAQNGAVISEYPPQTPSSRTTFPIRNRLISGLSLGTVVIEAGERSGSLITAHRALDQGRDVFAVPGDIISSAYTGANQLIREGAKPVFTALDILEEYALQYADTLNLEGAERPLGEAGDLLGLELPAEKASPALHTAHRSVGKKKSEPVRMPPKQPLPASLDPAVQKVYALFEEAPLHVDEIAAALSFPPQAVLAALTQLELHGLVAPLSGRRYQRKP